MAQDIAWFVLTCRLCQLRKTQQVSIPPVVTQPAPLFAKVYMDTMHLTPSCGYKYIVQARCSLTHCSTVHSPTFSAGFRWTHWNPADFAGLQICHILSHGGSAGVRWSPLE